MKTVNLNVKKNNILDAQIVSIHKISPTQVANKRVSDMIFEVTTAVKLNVTTLGYW